MDIRMLGVDVSKLARVERPVEDVSRTRLDPIEREQAGTRALSDSFRKMVEQSRAMDELSRGFEMPWLPHSARALHDLHTMQAQQSSRLAAAQAERAAAQAERDELQRQQVELTGTLIDVVSMMHADGAANARRSELRFKRSHDMQLAILGLTVLGIVVAIAALPR